MSKNEITTVGSITAVNVLLLLTAFLTSISIYLGLVLVLILNVLITIVSFKFKEDKEES